MLPKRLLLDDVVASKTLKVYGRGMIRRMTSARRCCVYLRFACRTPKRCLVTAGVLFSLAIFVVIMTTYCMACHDADVTAFIDNVVRHFWYFVGVVALFEDLDRPCI